MDIKNWNDMGCEKCREDILQGKLPKEIASSALRMGTLHKCVACGAIWEKQLQLTTIATEEIIKKYYSLDK